MPDIAGAEVQGRLLLCEFPLGKSEDQLHPHLSPGPGLGRPLEAQGQSQLLQPQHLGV